MTSQITINRHFWGVLDSWLKKGNRKPLVIRGMRQTGKSTSVRTWAKRSGLDLLEINLEKHTELQVVFKELKLQKIINELEAITKKKINTKSLIFLDEAQAVPESLMALRYFYEERPDIPVIATGSLLDFTLEGNKRFSMPVGRIEYKWHWPISFQEFVEAISTSFLSHTLTEAISNPESLTLTAHNEFLDLMKLYFRIGGMPAVVRQYIENRTLPNIWEIVSFEQNQIIDSLRDDFGKYASGRDLLAMQKVFRALPQQVGKKIKYANIDSEQKAHIVRSILELFRKARLIHFVHHTHANKIPIQANVDDKVFKIVFSDVGLYTRMLGLIEPSDTSFLDGLIAEQFVAQELFAQSSQTQNGVFYWLRDSKSGNAEVDYLIQNQTQIIPIEVKSGAKGRLQSLHTMMGTNNLTFAYRFDSQMPSIQNLNIKVNIDKELRSQNVFYTLNTLPLYLAQRVFLTSKS